MKKFIGCDAHKKYSVFAVLHEDGKWGRNVRVEHREEDFAAFCREYAAGTPVAVEAGGSWYWVVDNLERGGLEVHLVNPVRTHLHLMKRHKTDESDAKALAQLLRNGTLPEVWIPSAKLRDLRGLMRARLSLRSQGTLLKNRILAALRRHGCSPEKPMSDYFAGKGLLQLLNSIARLLVETRFATQTELDLLDSLEDRLAEMEKEIRLKIGSIGWVRRLKTMPGVGEILGATIYLEIGDAARFPSPQHLASYAGLVPTLHASGGKAYLGRTSRQSNQYLRWAFVEAANCIVMHGTRTKKESAHALALYARLKAAKGHSKAAVAVARHLAESAWWILQKKEDYRPPGQAAGLSSKERASAEFF